MGMNCVFLPPEPQYMRTCRYQGLYFRYPDVRCTVKRNSMVMTHSTIMSADRWPMICATMTEVKFCLLPRRASRRRREKKEVRCRQGNLLLPSAPLGV